MSAKIVQGSDEIFDIQLKDGNGNLYDLTGATLIQICIPKADGTTLTKDTGGGDISFPDPKCGIINVKLQETETPDLQVGSLGLDVIVTEASGDIKKVPIKNALNVVAGIC